MGLSRSTAIGIGIVVVLFVLVGAGIQIGPSGLIIGNQPVMALQSDSGNALQPDRVILDGNIIDSKSTISLSDLDLGEHDLLVIVKGVEYNKSFTFDGKSLSLTIEEPVQTAVFVTSSDGKSMNFVSVYSDAEFKCNTDNKGVCSFYEKPGKHSIKLQGSNFLKEELRTIAKDSNSFTFNIVLKYNAKVKALDKETNQPVKDATIEVDGVVKGNTNLNGELTVLDLNAGPHSFGVNYKGLSDKNVFDVVQDNQIISLYIVTPKTITVNVKDEFDNTPLEADVYLNGQWKGKSTSGKLEIKDVANGDYSLQAKYKGVDKIESITISPLQKEFTIFLKAPKTVTLELKDSETENPINSEEIRLDSTTSSSYRATLKTTQEGTVIIDDVLPGRYNIVLEKLFGYIGKTPSMLPSTMIDVGSQSQITAELDMPNPKFSTSLSCQRGFWYWQGTTCSVIVKNTDYYQGINSKDTSVVIFAYKVEGNTTSLLDKQLLTDYGSLESGESKSISSKTFPRDANYYLAAVIDEWKYTPENDKIVTKDGITVPDSILDRWLTDLGDALVGYCTDDIGNCVKTIADVVMVFL